MLSSLSSSPKSILKKGFFKREDILPNYQTLIVASSHEAFGRVILEANKAGLRVVVKNGAGSSELVNETNGLLYESTQELANILIGKKKLPDGLMISNYDEAQEIKKINSLLNTLLTT
jgi:glycosyltransferase involved in cell wall biosynthesis